VDALSDLPGIERITAFEDLLDAPEHPALAME